MRVLILILLFSVTTSLYSQEKGFFIGGSLLRASLSSQVQVKQSGNTISITSASDSGTGFSFRGGYNFGDWRAYGIASRSSYDGFETSEFLALANWLHESGFFIGGGLGSASMNWTQKVLDTDLGTASSSAIVFELGSVWWNVYDRLNLNLGIRSMSFNLESKLAVTGTAGVITTGNGLDHLWIGFDYLL